MLTSVEKKEIIYYFQILNFDEATKLLNLVEETHHDNLENLIAFQDIIHLMEAAISSEHLDKVKLLFQRFPDLPASHCSNHFLRFAFTSGNREIMGWLFGRSEFIQSNDYYEITWSLIESGNLSALHFAFENISNLAALFSENFDWLLAIDGQFTSFIEALFRHVPSLPEVISDCSENTLTTICSNIFESGNIVLVDYLAEKLTNFFDEHSLDFLIGAVKSRDIGVIDWLLTEMPLFDRIEIAYAKCIAIEIDCRAVYQFLENMRLDPEENSSPTEIYLDERTSSLQLLITACSQPHKYYQDKVFSSMCKLGKLSTNDQVLLQKCLGLSIEQSNHQLFAKIVKRWFRCQSKPAHFPNYCVEVTNKLFQQLFWFCLEKSCFAILVDLSNHWPEYTPAFDHDKFKQFQLTDKYLDSAPIDVIKTQEYLQQSFDYLGDPNLPSKVFAYHVQKGNMVNVEIMLWKWPTLFPGSLLSEYAKAIPGSNKVLNRLTHARPSLILPVDPATEFIECCKHGRLSKNFSQLLERSAEMHFSAEQIEDVIEILTFDSSFQLVPLFLPGNNCQTSFGSFPIANLEIAKLVDALLLIAIKCENISVIKHLLSNYSISKLAMVNMVSLAIHTSKLAMIKYLIQYYAGPDFLFSYASNAEVVNSIIETDHQYVRNLLSSYCAKHGYRIHWIADHVIVTIPNFPGMNTNDKFSSINPITPELCQLVSNLL